MATELPNDDRMAYRVKEVMALLGLGRNLVYELIRSEKLVAIKAGRATIIPRSSIENFLSGQ